MNTSTLSDGSSSASSKNKLEQKADNYSLIVPIESVELPANLPRKESDLESLTELSKNITTHGILVPLIVLKSPAFSKDKQSYSLLSGLRRYQAAKIAGLKELPIRIFHCQTNEEKISIQLSENIQRKNLKPVEVALIIRQFLELNFKDLQISKTISKSLSWVSQYKKIGKMPKQILEDPITLKSSLSDLLSLESKFLKHSDLLNAWEIYKEDGLKSALRWPDNKDDSSNTGSAPSISNTNIGSKITREFMIMTEDQKVLNCKLQVSDNSKNDFQVILPKEFDFKELKEVFEKILISIQAK